MEPTVTLQGLPERSTPKSDATKCLRKAVPWSNVTNLLLPGTHRPQSSQGELDADRCRIAQTIPPSTHPLPQPRPRPSVPPPPVSDPAALVLFPLNLTALQLYQ
jgi:hypothetical protein